MKIRTLILGSVGLAALLLVSSAPAANMVVTRIGGYYWSNGGELNVSTPDGSLNGVIAGYDSKATAVSPITQLRGLETFCLEHDERVQMNTSVNYGISSRAISGGSGGPSPDPISLGTAWLYSQFAQGTLAGYDWDPLATRSTSAGLLQKTFWWLEDEAGYAYDAANPFMLAAVNEFGATVKDDAGANNFGTWVINAGPARLYPYQDMLIWKKPGVPDGGITVILLGLGLSALGLIRRKVA